jgi:hypothetical protein
MQLSRHDVVLLVLIAFNTVLQESAGMHQAISCPLCTSRMSRSAFAGNTIACEPFEPATGRSKQPPAVRETRNCCLLRISRPKGCTVVCLSGRCDCETACMLKRNRASIRMKSRR